jgi:hypothetical protein
MKAEGAEAQFDRILVGPFGVEAQVCVELQRKSKVFGGHKGFEIDNRCRQRLCHF